MPIDSNLTPKGRAGRAWLVGLASLTLLAGYLVADAFDRVPGFVTVAPRLIEPTPYQTHLFDPVKLEGDNSTKVAPATTTLASYEAAGTLPTSKGIERVLAGALAQPVLGGAVAVSVIDVATSKQVYSLRGEVPVAPASATKILTASAALSVLDPASRLNTTVKAEGNEIYLVGGGDITLDLVSATPHSPLEHASLAGLADKTAAALKLKKIISVSLKLDTSLFSGPATLPSWDPSFVGTGIVSPVSPLAVNIGRTQPIEYSPRQPDPALAAAQQFAALLQLRGISVAPPIVRETAPKTASVIAQVQSAPLADLISYMLKTSDNTIAEVIGHLIAIRQGQPADFVHATPAVVSVVKSLAPKIGADASTLSMVDSSGLSNLNRITPDLLNRFMLASYHRSLPNVAPIALHLPIAGYSGTLAKRFHAPSAVPLDGILHAKTGTLKGILTLVGYVPDAAGRLLMFSIVNTNLKDNTFIAGQAAMDQVAVALASCGCNE